MKDPPAGYPQELETTIEAGGMTVHVRPVVPGDAGLLADEFAAADAETLRMRFFVPRPNLSPQDFERLTDVDYRERLALTAWHGTQPIAIARYEPAGNRVAEVAFVVKPEYRGRGIGTMLIDLLAAAATERGYERFDALYLGENLAAAASLARAGFDVRNTEGGIVEASRRLGS